MKVKLVVERGGKRKTLRVEPPVAVIGRAKGNAVRIPSAHVSRQHCRLRIEGGLVHVEDLGSVNGTFLNGRRISRREVVRPGDELDVGAVRFIVEYEMDAKAKAKLPPPDSVDDVEVLDDVLGGLADGSLVGSLDDYEEEAVDIVSEAGEEELDELIPFDPDMESFPTLPPVPPPPAAPQRPDFTFNQPWQMPDAGDLRDILSQMEEDDRPSPPKPPPPPPRKKK